jgi:hypothetical protein
MRREIFKVQNKISCLWRPGSSPGTGTNKIERYIMKKRKPNKLKYSEEELFLYPTMSKRQTNILKQRKSEQSYVFSRIDWKKRVNGLIMKAAKYPMAIPEKDGWKEIHDWCKENLRNKFGQVEYTWTGEKFWFPNEEVKKKFVDKWGDSSGNS